MWRRTIPRGSQAAPPYIRVWCTCPFLRGEETRAGDPEYPCCTFRGSIVALRIKDGTQVWKTYMTPPPKATGKSKRGTPIFGPSGVGVWSTPTVDPKRGVLYITTGDNYSAPDTDTSDAVIALSLKTGDFVWKKQITAADVYSGACAGTKDCGPDFDFGSSAILVNSGGRELYCSRAKIRLRSCADPDKKGDSFGRRASAREAPMAACSGDGDRWPARLRDGFRRGRTRQTNMTSDPRRYILDPRQAADSPRCASPMAARSGM